MMYHSEYEMMKLIKRPVTQLFDSCSHSVRGTWSNLVVLIHILESFYTQQLEEVGILEEDKNILDIDHGLVKSIIGVCSCRSWGGSRFV